MELPIQFFYIYNVHGNGSIIVMNNSTHYIEAYRRELLIEALG